MNYTIIIITIITFFAIIIWLINSQLFPPKYIIESMDGGPIKGGTVNIFQQALDGLKKLPKHLISFQKALDNLGKAFNSEAGAIGKSLKYMGTDFADIMAGLKDAPPFLNAAFEEEANNIKSVFDTGAGDLTDWFNAAPSAFDPYLFDTNPISDEHPLPDGVFDRTSRYIQMYSNCTNKYSNNFLRCMGWYFLDTLGQTAYLLTVTQPIFLINLLSGCDVSKYYEMGFNGIECIDEAWYGFAGFHLIHYSDYTLNLCYYCDGIPHKGTNDHIAAPEPTMPMLSAPDFPQDIANSNKAMDRDFNHIIPARMGAIGKFITNNIDKVNNINVGNAEVGQLLSGFTGISDEVPISDKYRNAAKSIKDGLGDAVGRAEQHFGQDIPNAFNDATSDFDEMSRNFHDAFN